MPRSANFENYIGEDGQSSYIIKDLNNKTTEIKHELIQTVDCDKRTINDEPRIISVKYPTDKKPSLKYEYKQYIYPEQTRQAHPCTTGADNIKTPRMDPLVTKATLKGRARLYQFPFQLTGPIRTRVFTEQNDEADKGNYIRVDWVATHGAPERLDKFGYDYEFYTADRRRNFGYSNDLKVYAGPEGPIRFRYDSRSNITRRTSYVFNQPEKDIIRTEAKYPDTCTNPKTCNKPIWIKDGKGNKTDYTYHEASGQIATITYPADDNGIRPQTRFQYAQKYAYYIQDHSKKIKRAPSPVWMLVERSGCQSSAAKIGGGCQKSGDEIKTLYDYGQPHKPNNLFLKGVTVLANGKSRKICYQYDKYGNKIGETEPKANLASCP